MNRKLNRKTSPPLKDMKPYTKANEPVRMLTDQVLTRQKIDRLKSWITFYRINPSYFVEHYMGVKLYPYQRYWINLMARSTKFVGIASRASAKSWLIAVYSIARCILYPGTIVALASSTKGQAGLIISQWCTALTSQHPNIAREKLTIVTNQNKWEMTFLNGSSINVVVSGERGRGHRSNVTVLEERRLIPSIIIDSVIRPFAVSRQPPYMNDPAYSKVAELREEAQEVIITSAHYKSAEWYPETKKLLREIVSGDPDIKCMFLNYQISVYHGIKTKKQMIREQKDLDPVTFLMEYGNIPYGSSVNSFYKLGLFNRTVKRGWRPVDEETYITTKKNPYDIPKLHGEVRIVSVDIAMVGGSTNDNTVISCARLMPTRKGWASEITFIESHNGKRTDVQALRIKQIYEEFEGDVLVLDIANAGISIYDALCSVTKDETRGLEYRAYGVMNSPYIENDRYKYLLERTLGQDALPCIFPIYGTPPLNSFIAVKFRERLKKRLVTFLVEDNIEEEYLIRTKNKDILDTTDSGIRAYLLKAHWETTLFVNEAIALEMVLQGGLVKLEEPDGARKDRYTSVAYLNYYVSLMDVELLKEDSYGDDESEFLGVSITV